MKKLIALAAALVLLLASAPPVADATPAPNEVDILRGAWGGTLDTRTGPPPQGQPLSAQLNMYFNESVAGAAPRSFRASGYSSITWQDPDKPKRAKAELLPMIADYRDLEDGTFDIEVLATLPTPPWSAIAAKAIFRFEGQVRLSGRGVPDDLVAGNWFVKRPDGSMGSGTWSATHLDRRNVGAPDISLADPTLYFRVDAYAGLAAVTPSDVRSSRTLLMVNSNIAMDRVCVYLPDGSSLLLAPYTDPFSPGVDWISEFRFANLGNSPAMPISGGLYTFVAVDVAGNPIPGVRGTDVWMGPPAVPPPAPIPGVSASLASGAKPGILASWGPVPSIPGSLEPPELGFYQIEVYDPSGRMVYGANHLGNAPPAHVIPSLRTDFVAGIDWGSALGELADGTYRLDMCVHSVAPDGSAGHGFEYNVKNPSQTWRFDMSCGMAGNLRRAPW